MKAAEMLPITEIADAPPQTLLGIAIHVFQIETESRTFRVFVEGHDVRVIEALAVPIIN